MKITVDNLSVHYGGHAALAGASLEARPGEILAVIGPNGSGKSSLVKAMAGIAPHTGQILFDGARRRPPSLGYMPQDGGARAALTVMETVLLGRLGRLGLRVGRADIEAVSAVLAELGLSHLAARDLAALSGGQRQLVFLAQALASDPPILILDEPLSALDIRHQLEVMDLIERLTRARSLTTVVVLHDLPLTARCAGRLAVLKAGRLVGFGATAEIFCEEMIASVFGVAATIGKGCDDRLEMRGLRLLAAA